MFEDKTLRFTLVHKEARVTMGRDYEGGCERRTGERETQAG